MAKRSAPAAATSAPSAVADVLLPDDLVLLEEQVESTDLSYWEFVNQSDADSDNESLLSVENGFLAWYSLNTVSPPESSETSPEIQIQNTHLEEEDLVDQVNFPDYPQFYFASSNFAPLPLENHKNDDSDEDSDDDVVDDEDGYGLDDELVPWSVCGKLGRQRMRKLGKRAPKQNPYRIVKAGCVRGKHGLGIKA